MTSDSSESCNKALLYDALLMSNSIQLREVDTDMPLILFNIRKY